MRSDRNIVPYILEYAATYTSPAPATVTAELARSCGRKSTAQRSLQPEGARLTVLFHVAVVLVVLGDAGVRGEHRARHVAARGAALEVAPPIVPLAPALRHRVPPDIDVDGPVWRKQLRWSETRLQCKQPTAFSDARHSQKR